MDPTLHYLKRADVGDEDNRHRQFPAMVVNIEKDAKLIQTLDTVEKQSNFDDQRPMTVAEAWCKQAK